MPAEAGIQGPRTDIARVTPGSPLSRGWRGEVGIRSVL